MVIRVRSAISIIVARILRSPSSERGGLEAAVDGVHRVQIDANWLNSNQELLVCLAQPQLVAPGFAINDLPRPESVSLAQAIFRTSGNEVDLSRWLGGSPGLLMFPEYAFGSGDFDALNQLISAFPTPLIVLAGFGAAKGDALTGLLNRCKSTWPRGATAIDSQARYNGGWCWVHQGPGRTDCHVFLKNYIEQRFELAAIPGLIAGTSILRVETNDLVLYPLICADLLSTENAGPRARIRQSQPLRNGSPDRNKRMLVAGLLYSDKPFHDLWRGVINDIVTLHGQTAALMTVNQLVAPPQQEADQDKWRCLSGAFINKAIMAACPSDPLQPVRYVSTDSASGLIMRQPRVGVACGRLRWVDSATEGRNVWVPHARRVFEGGILTDVSDTVSGMETRRYIGRRRHSIEDRYNGSRLLVVGGLDEMLRDVLLENLTPRLWPKLLYGVESVPAPISADDIDTTTPLLEPALGVLAAVQNVTVATPLAGTTYSGQLKWNLIEILVWNAMNHDGRSMIKLLQNSAKDNAREPRLIVLGKGKNGREPSPSEIQSDRLTDFTIAPGSGGITSARFRHVSWRLIGDVENILTDPDPDKTLDQKRAAILAYLNGN